MIISINAEKAFDKIQNLFRIKTLNEVGLEGTYLNIIKIKMKNSKLTSYSMVKKVRAFSPRSGIRQGCPLSPVLFNIAVEVLDTANRQEK